MDVETKMTRKADGATSCATIASGTPSTKLICSDTPKPVLIIVHQKHSNPGRIGQWLVQNGYPLDIRRPRFGCPLPETLEEHAGAVIFGGPMSANDNEGYLRQEIDWIGVPLREDRPFLGVCLGAQLMALHLGAAVGPHTDDFVEIGYYDIEATEAGARFGDWPTAFYQWHREGFELPEGSTLLARTQWYENQAFSYGSSALGVQFHPEITYALVNRWTIAARERLVLRGAQSQPEHFRGHLTHSPSVGNWLDCFMPQWLNGSLANR